MTCQLRDSTVLYRFNLPSRLYLPKTDFSVQESEVTTVAELAALLGETRFVVFLLLVVVVVIVLIFFVAPKYGHHNIFVYVMVSKECNIIVEIGT